MKHALSIISGLLLAALVAPSLWANEPSTLAVSVKSYPNWFALDAQIEAVNQATTSAQTSGRVQSIEVDVNDYVKEGDLIIQLRNNQQKSAVDQAQAGLNQAQAMNTDAQSKLERATPLFKQGSISKGEYDSIKANATSAAAQVKAARALLSQSKEQLSYTQIRAPYAGIVRSRLVEVGESVSPGTPLMTGLSLSELRAVAHLPQRFINKINQESHLKVIYKDKDLDVNNITIFPFADSSSHSFKIRADINAKGAGLFPGMWVKLMLPIGDTQTLRIPETAIVRQGQVSYVYVKKGDAFALRQIRIGGQTHVNNENQRSVYIDVLAGLKEADVIALDPQTIMAAQEI
jgi:RND family efflux transporter MFP subunit